MNHLQSHTLAIPNPVLPSLFTLSLSLSLQGRGNEILPLHFVKGQNDKKGGWVGKTLPL